MQVSYQNDHVTHAVIGGKQAIEFGISNSAEFFNILSSTLYKDQILAVVREVLCNAWDAHIETGCTDRPVLVTLTNTEFIIQDFGKGIHHDDMGTIYGTYGNSTKKNDGNQTGGFGLGCKAPFAYTDHFEVTSCHAGIRTIYNLAKSSAQAMGKPGIVPIASFPTQDSGLTVKIRIKPNDFTRFRDLVTRIAHNGDMNVHLNGKQLDTLNFNVSKHNFLVTRKSLLDLNYRILVRYGNVVYPVDSNSLKGFGEILNHLNSLSGTQNQFSIVFQAPPHSIAVTPSRESLSMQDHTIKTLETLFRGFLDSLNTEFKQACREYAATAVQKAVTEDRVDELLKRTPALPVVVKERSVELTLANFNEMAKTYLEFNYPRDIEYRKADITQRLKAMIQHNQLDRGKAEAFLKELGKVRKQCTEDRTWHIQAEQNHWLQRYIVAPMVKRLIAAGLDPKKLHACNNEDHNHRPTSREGVSPLVPAQSVSPHHLLVTLPFLRNIVVISTRRQDLVSHAYQHEVFQKYGRYHGYLVYIAGRKKGELEAVRTFFAQQGMKVVDLATEKAEVSAPAPRAVQPSKPAKKGIPQLSGILHYGGIRTDKALNDNIGRIESPKFVVQVSFRSGVSNNMLGNWPTHQSFELVKRFGHEGGITNSKAMYNKYLEKGALGFDEYVCKKVCEFILNNPRIEAYWANQLHLGGSISKKNSLYRLISRNPVLSKDHGIHLELTEEEQAYMGLWNTLSGWYNSYCPHPEVKQTKEWLKGIPHSQAVTDLLKKLDAPMVQFTDVDSLRYALHSEDKQSVEEVRATIKTILNT